MDRTVFIQTSAAAVIGNTTVVAAYTPDQKVN
jgi:hypothetical protein